MALHVNLVNKYMTLKRIGIDVLTISRHELGFCVIARQYILDTL